MKIVCLGDSLTFGYQLAYQKKWHVLVAEKTGIKMVNKGINGDTTASMVARFQRDVIDGKPDKMILMAGYNDIFFNGSWDKTKENMKVMVEEAKDQKIRVIVAIPPPILLPVLFREEDQGIDFDKSFIMIEDYCQWLRHFIVEMGLAVIDFREAVDWTNRDLYLDGIHQSIKGHQLMAEKVIDYFKGMTMQV